MGNKSSTAKACKSKKDGDTCTFDNEKDKVKNAATYTCQEGDVAGKLECRVKTCNTGYTPKSDNKSCLTACAKGQEMKSDKCETIAPSYPATAKPWTLAAINKNTKGFKAVAGHVDHNPQPAPGYKAITMPDGTEPTTIQACYENASSAAKVVGFRTNEHPSDHLKNQCFEYDSGYATFIDKPKLQTGDHVMTCKNPVLDITKKECYRSQSALEPTGFSSSSFKSL
jgi:hypothetical protein